MYKIILFEGDKNDATSFYLDIIRDAIILAGNSAEYIENISNIHQCDNVIGITPKAFWKIRRSKNANLIFNWFQGVIPEEITYYTYANWKKLIMKGVYSWLENFVLRKSDFNFFVSNEMVQHYKRKYNYKKNNYFVMPCFNQPLLENAFTNEKYAKPTFVYTGNLAKWQCFEQMVALYKKIKEKLPLATLTIYTKEKEDAISILHKYGVDADITYVPYQQLAEEIKQYKYGFILRENNVVNNVATPTKMNSYLASGIIPIYTDVVGAYKENLSHLKYSVPLDVNNLGIEKLMSLENTEIKGLDVLEDYKTVFAEYYNREFYINEIAKRIKDISKK